MNKDIKCIYCKAYFIKEYDFNNNFTDEEPESKGEEDEVVIIIILKKVLYKIFKYKWLINTDVISYMTNDFNIYKSFLKSCHKVI